MSAETGGVRVRAISAAIGRGRRHLAERELRASRDVVGGPPARERDEGRDRRLGAQRRERVHRRGAGVVGGLGHQPQQRGRRARVRAERADRLAADLSVGVIDAREQRQGDAGVALAGDEPNRAQADLAAVVVQGGQHRRQRRQGVVPLQRVEGGDAHGGIRIAQRALDGLAGGVRQAGRLAQDVESELAIDERDVGRGDPAGRRLDGGRRPGAPEATGGEQADAGVAIDEQRHQHGQGPLAGACGQALQRPQPLGVGQLGGVLRGEGDRIGPAEVRIGGQRARRPARSRSAASTGVYRSTMLAHIRHDARDHRQHPGR